MRNKGNTYFDRLRELASITLEGARAMCDGGDMQKISVKADKVKNELLQSLAEEFLPPLEREDIAALTFALSRLLHSCAEIKAHLDFCDKESVGESLILNIYYYIKIIYDAVVCLGEATRGENLRKCIEQMNLLSAKCADALIQSRKVLIYSGGIKKPLAGIVLCDACGGCYDELDSFCELLETVIIKND